MEPKLVPKPPEGDDWIHEIKLDGYRVQIVINSTGDIRVFTKTGADWTSKFAGLVEAARELEVENAIIDGEAVVPNEAGLPDFAALQKAVHNDPYAMMMGAFDILATICAILAARAVGKSSTAKSSRTAGSNSARLYLVTRRRSSTSSIRPASRALSRSPPTASIAAARHRTG
ncbi:hypothetical protein [Mesorhizobium sp.]|uniref:ATP-dependent DNA ligase n=1 Tax=Mesorhizobium sp. TaxID=1871066 RepID=UPI0025EB3177|nr:hypothetical protein [Mesorhizobium sp.]